MTARRFVHEKTLELNLTAEILSRVRQRKSFANAYVIGMTQERESRNGVDSAIMGIRRLVGAIQFKAPHRPQFPRDYRFTLERNQLQHLQRLERSFPGLVSYYLPRIATQDELRLGSPTYLTVTNTLPVAGLPPGAHRVVCSVGSALVFSEPVEFQSESAAEELERWLDEAEAGVVTEQEGQAEDREALLSWLAGVDDERGRVAGQVLRGLAVYAIPRAGEPVQ